MRILVFFMVPVGTVRKKPKARELTMESQRLSPCTSSGMVGVEDRDDIALCRSCRYGSQGPSPPSGCPPVRKAFYVVSEIANTDASVMEPNSAPNWIRVRDLSRSGSVPIPNTDPDPHR